MSTVRKFINQHKRAPSFLIFIGILVCISSTCVILFRSKLRINITSTNEFSLPSRYICHRSDGTTFLYNQIKPVVVRKTDNQYVYPNKNNASSAAYIPRNYSSLDEFILTTRGAVLARQLVEGSHSIQTIFRDPPYNDMVKPSCDGLWMEFGVFRGATISHIAKWKSKFCPDSSEPVYGFDTFTGLPTSWRPGFDRGKFSVPNGTRVSVPSNVVLVKGLFIDTLPTQLRVTDLQYRCRTPVSFVHIDCDIYDGTRDVLFLLGTRFVRGTIVVFDELFNYPNYEQHEIKALFEFTAGSGVRLIPLGSSGDIQLKPTTDTLPQSFAFVVA